MKRPFDLLLFELKTESNNIDNHVQYYPTISSGRRGVIIGTLNDYLGGDYYRTIFLAILHNYPVIDGKNLKPISSKELSNGEWWSLYGWCGFHQEDGIWQPGDQFKEEVLEVSRAISYLTQGDNNGTQ